MHITIFSSPMQLSVKVMSLYVLDHLAAATKMGPAIHSHFRCLLNTAAALFEQYRPHILHLGSSNNCMLERVLERNGCVGVRGSGPDVWD